MSVRQGLARKFHREVDVSWFTILNYSFPLVKPYFSSSDIPCHLIGIAAKIVVRSLAKYLNLRVQVVALTLL
jgi:hypothetical protein